MSLRRQIKEAILKDLNLPGLSPDDIDDEAPLFGEGLGLDSLDAVELVVMVQKNFQVEILNMQEGKEAFQSVAALAAFIEKRRP